MHNKNISPVGWYIGTYLQRFLDLENRCDDPEETCLAWENTVIIKASDLDEAYDKVVEIGKSEPYKGGPDGVPVQWEFEGVLELVPIYEEFEDGAELMYREHSRSKLKNLRKGIRQKGEFHE